MDKVKLRRIMAESVLLRETALSVFKKKLSTKTYAEAKKVFKEMGVENEEELEEKVMDGEIDAEALDMPDEESEPVTDDGDLSTEAAEDDSTQEDGDLSTEACEDEEDKSNVEKIVKILEKLDSRIRKIEGGGISDQDGHTDLKAGSSVDGDLDESEVDKEVSAGALPEGIEEDSEYSEAADNKDDMSEMNDDEMSETDEDEEEMPQPPIVRESLGNGMYSVDVKKSSKLSSETLNSLFK